MRPAATPTKDRRRPGTLRVLFDADVRSVTRDPLLAWILILPIGVALTLRVLVPAARDGLATAVGFDLARYYPLVMGGYLMTAPGIVGLVVGFLLLDERDSRTLSALRVSPLSMRRYLAYRVALPLAAGTLATLVGYPLTGLVRLPVGTLLPLAIVAAPTAPVIALVLAAAAPNKVAGFALVKALNGLSLLPIVAYFFPLPLQMIAGVLPQYWPMRAVWSAAAGESSLGYLAAGAAIGMLWVLVSAGWFDRSLSRRG